MLLHLSLAAAFFMLRTARFGLRALFPTFAGDPIPQSLYPCTPSRYISMRISMAFSCEKSSFLGELGLDFERDIIAGKIAAAPVAKAAKPA